MRGGRLVRTCGSLSVILGTRPVPTFQWYHPRPNAVLGDVDRQCGFKRKELETTGQVDSGPIQLTEFFLEQSLHPGLP